MIPTRKQLDHHEVKQLLPRLRDGSLDAETEGRVQGHLDACDECLTAFGEEIDSAVEKGLLPEIEVPPMPEIPIR